MREITLRLAAPLVEVVRVDPQAAPPGAAEPRVELPAASRPAAGSGDADREALATVLAALDEAGRSVEAHLAELLPQLQALAVELAVAIASRVCRRQLEAGELAIEEQVRELVARLEARRPVTVRLHPQDLELLKRRVGAEGRVVPGAEIQLVADPSLPRGGCRAESGDVSLLAEMNSQLEELRRHLLGTLSDAEVERRKAAPGDRNLRRFPDRRQTA